MGRLFPSPTRNHSISQSPSLEQEIKQLERVAEPLPAPGWENKRLCGSRRASVSQGAHPDGAG